MITNNWIKSRLGLLAILLLGVVNPGITQQTPHVVFERWSVQELLPGGRFDAIAHVGGHTVVMGSRGKNPGQLFISRDLGQTWENTGKITEDEITCISHGGGDLVYLLTGKSNFYRSEDGGQSWKWLGTISNNKNTEGYTLSYGIFVTKSGTVLVSDTESSGGHIYRSEDRGDSWHDVGVVSPRALYRFQGTDQGVLVNGWHGSIYRSTDDGLTWEETGRLADSPLYATEYLGDNIVLQGSEAGHVYRSTDEGESWQDLGKISEAADDMVDLGNGAVLLTTYRQAKHLYLSLDFGLTWENLGPLNTGVEGDWFDHVIQITQEDGVVMVGGSHAGFAVRGEVRR
ncbi:sialidase family protein [Lunatimonas lonarensis]|nr:sialidase family protein [Lunatimonas lonarensis]